MKNFRIGKYTIDSFFAVAHVAGVVLFFVAPGRRHDVVAYIILVTGLLVADVLLNNEFEEEE